MNSEGQKANQTNSRCQLACNGNPADISKVRIDKSKSVAERIEDYISQTGNPYCFVCGKTPVEIRFASESSPSLDKIIIDFFIRKKSRKQAEF